MSETLTIKSIKSGGQKYVDFIFEELNESDNNRTYCCRWSVLHDAVTQAELDDYVLNNGYTGLKMEIVRGEHEMKFITPRFHLINSHSVYIKNAHDENWDEEHEQRHVERIKSYAVETHEQFLEDLFDQINRSDATPLDSHFNFVFKEIINETPFQTP